MTGEGRSGAMAAELLAAALAGAAGFLLPAGLLLSQGFFGGWSIVALLVAVPAAVIAPMPSSARAFCLALGLLGAAGTGLMELGGPDSPLLIFPLAALSLGAAAVIAELCARAAERLVQAAKLPGGDAFSEAAQEPGLGERVAERLSTLPR